MKSQYTGSRAGTTDACAPTHINGAKNQALVGASPSTFDSHTFFGNGYAAAYTWLATLTAVAILCLLDLQVFAAAIFMFVFMLHVADLVSEFVERFERGGFEG